MGKRTLSPFAFVLWTALAEAPDGSATAAASEADLAPDEAGVLVEHVQAQAEPEAPATPTPSPVADLDHYKLGAGDILSVSVYEEPELTGTFAVAEDGHIDYPLLGRIAVGGLTVGAADDLVTAALGAKYLKSPQVSIGIQSFKSQFVEVVGAVKEPGIVQLTRTTTLFEVLTQCGWISDTAVNEVRIQRNGTVETIALDKLIAPGASPPLVYAGDVVFVPQGVVVYVSGEVAEPGAVQFREGLTLSQAVVEAGGPTQTANTKRVIIQRGDERIDVDLKKIRKGRAGDIMLHANDQIVVSESVF